MPGIFRAQDIQSVQTAFTKTTREKTRTEHIEGTLYFETAHGIVIQITAPVCQWLISEKNSLLIYYPDEKYAFRIPMQSAVTFPFFQAFLGAMKEDFGLTQLGFSLRDNTMHGDTLITVWAPPKAAADEIGGFTLSHLGDKIVCAELHSGTGSLISSSNFSDHVQYKTYYFPCEMSTCRYTDIDTTREHIVFTNPQFNVNIADSILNFRLPEDVEIERVEW